MVTQTQRILPAPYVTGMGEQFGSYFANPFMADGTTPNPGYTDITSSPFYVDPSSFTGAGFVAPESKYTIDARNLAGGLGGYQQYLDQAGKLTGAAEDLIYDPVTGQARPGPGAGAIANAGSAFDAAQIAAKAGQGASDPYLAAAAGYTGPNAYKQFMSPYQQEVIDSTMADYQSELAKQRANLGASAGNAFGGGRFGVAEGELLGQGARGMAATLADLRQKGFGQANELANQAYNQQMGLGSAAMDQAGQNVSLYGTAAQGQLSLANAQQAALQNQLANLGGAAATQMDMGNYQMAGLGNQINALTQMGDKQTLYNQAVLDAMRSGIEAKAYAPQQAAGFLGQMLGTAQGSQAQTRYTTTPGPSTAQTLLGGGIGILGLLGAGGMFGGNNQGTT